jgi:hypothetical protein
LAHKITLTGNPCTQLKNIDKILAFDLEIGGSKGPPKGLPSSEPAIKYTVFCNQKQLKKAGLLEGDITIHKLLIQGEPVMDLPGDKCSGRIGVVCYKVEILSEKKSEEKTDVAAETPPKVIVEPPKTAEPVKTEPVKVQKETLPLDEIIIPEQFLKTPPRREKITETIDYYKKHGKFEKPVFVKEKTMMLVDGYKRYVAAKELGLNEIAVKFK